MSYSINIVKILVVLIFHLLGHGALHLLKKGNKLTFYPVSSEKKLNESIFIFN